jgi:hypothetical protein
MNLALKRGIWSRDMRALQQASPLITRLAEEEGGQQQRENDGGYADEGPIALMQKPAPTPDPDDKSRRRSLAGSREVDGPADRDDSAMTPHLGPRLVLGVDACRSPRLWLSEGCGSVGFGWAGLSSTSD